ncbi:MAG: hypothetical protein JXB05_01005 [Myxococcaceae bacterium]|nr:hypothetical protein [Myxococcaceae bacterium]
MNALCTLPGGWIDRKGVRQREGVLRPLRGGDEEWLYTLPPHTSQASVLITLLARCVRHLGPYRASRAMIRMLPAGDCDYLALRLYRMTFGDKVEMVLVCPNPACGAKMDLDFDASLLPVEERPQLPRYTLRLGLPNAAEVSFRLPRIGDVEAANGARDPEVRLLSRCLLDIDGKAPGGEEVVAALPAEAREALNAELERVSPRIEDSIEASCPECGREFRTAFDSTALLFANIYRRRREFNHAVHLLSFHYHWPLSEILGMTREQRQRYVRLLQDELDLAAGMSAGLD